MAGKKQKKAMKKKIYHNGYREVVRDTHRLLGLLTMYNVWDVFQALGIKSNTEEARKIVGILRALDYKVTRRHDHYYVRGFKIAYDGEEGI